MGEKQWMKSHNRMLVSKDADFNDRGKPLVEGKTTEVSRVRRRLSRSGFLDCTVAESKD